MIRLRRLPLRPDHQKWLNRWQAKLAGLEPYDDRVGIVWENFRDSPLRKAIVLKLESQSRWRCLYCETPGSANTIEHYYPKKQFPAHTFEWENLGLACGACQSYKVEPLEFQGVWPLIIDPFSEVVEDYLYISVHNGRMGPALYLQEGEPGWKRARETIERLRLNERGLPQQRLAVALNLLEVLRDYQESPCPRTEGRVLTMIYPGQPWPAVVRQILCDPEGEYTPLVEACLETSPRIRGYLQARNWLL